jgi:hypothetical protein
MRFFRLTLIMQVQCMLANAATVDDVKNKVRYHGTSVLGVEHYQNIKYAHDTSGDGRFSPPISYKSPPSSEVAATSPSVACPQSKAALPPFFAETDEISEDCLTLRIVRPAGTISSNRLPVVVWIHGGGVVKGSAYDPHFDPDRLISPEPKSIRRLELPNHFFRIRKSTPAQKTERTKRRYERPRGGFRMDKRQH